MKIFAAIYNPMIEESAYCTLSLHATLEGANKVIKKHKDEQYKIWKRFSDQQRKSYVELNLTSEQLEAAITPFERWEDWKVEEMEVLD